MKSCFDLHNRVLCTFLPKNISSSMLLMLNLWRLAVFFNFRQILFAIQFLLQQLKHNEAGIVKLAIDVMVKVLSLGKVGRIYYVFLGFVIVHFFN